MWRGVILEYWDFLPVRREDCVITLLEGNTPLIPSSRIKKEVIPGIDRYFKYEGLNPTGSFKDRGMTVAVSMAKEMDSMAVIKLHRKGFFKKGDGLVLALTGHGLKDPDTAIRVSQKPVSLPPKKEKVLETLNL